MKTRLNVAPSEPTIPALSEDERVNFARVLLLATNAPGLRKTERTRLRLLASIASQISTGAEAADLRVADVTAAAGLAHGTFYRYFPQLRSAVEALIIDFARFLRDQLANAREGASGSRARVRGATLVYIRLFRVNLGLMRCLITLGRDDTAFRKAYQELNEEWNRRMASAIARRRAVGPATNPSLSAALVPTAYALGGMIDEFLTQLYLRKDPVLSYLTADEAAVADLLTDLWCLGAYGRLRSAD